MIFKIDVIALWHGEIFMTNHGVSTMDLSTVDYILKGIAILSLGTSIYLLVKHFEPKSIIMKLLYMCFAFTTLGVAFGLPSYFVTEESINRPMNVVAELMFDFSVASAGIASLLRLQELLPLLSSFSTAQKMKNFQLGVRIAISLIVLSLIRNIVGRFLWLFDYTTGWVYNLFYWKAGLIFYIIAIFSDLVSCTWISVSINYFCVKNKQSLGSTSRIKILLLLVYSTAGAGATIGAISSNGIIDILDYITANVIIIYLSLLIQILVEMKRLCAKTFKLEKRNQSLVMSATNTPKNIE